MSDREGRQGRRGGSWQSVHTARNAARAAQAPPIAPRISGFALCAPSSSNHLSRAEPATRGSVPGPRGARSPGPAARAEKQWLLALGLGTSQAKSHRVTG